MSGTMETQRHPVVSCAHLLRMAALTQRTVDLAVKAYALNSADFVREVGEAGKKLHEIELSISDRGRTFLTAGKLMDSTSRSACCSLRIYSALRITHAAATEMARYVRLKQAKEKASPSASTTELGTFVNLLVRLNTVAVFNRDCSHAKAVLYAEGGRRKFVAGLLGGHEDPQESSIVRCLEQIAEQAYEIADAVTHLRPIPHALSSFVSHSRLPEQGSHASVKGLRTFLITGRAAGIPLVESEQEIV